jgi:hypothetical protein
MIGMTAADEMNEMIEMTEDTTGIETERGWITMIVAGVGALVAVAEVQSEIVIGIGLERGSRWIGRGIGIEIFIVDNADFPSLWLWHELVGTRGYNGMAQF